MGLVVALWVGGDDGEGEVQEVWQTVRVPVVPMRPRAEIRAEEVDARLVAPTPPAAPTGEPDSPLGSPLEGGANQGFASLETLPYVEQVSPGLVAIICSFDWLQGCDYWVAVASCESSLRPHAIGYSGQFVGLFQVWTDHGYGDTWLLDPSNNTLAAWELSDGGLNTTPWPVCKYQ